MNKFGRWLMMLTLAFALGANVGCQSSSNANGGSSSVGSGQQKGSSLEPILGSLDAPARGSTLRETGIVGGWAVAGSGVKRVSIYIDRQFVRFVGLDGKRPDIAKLYAKDYPGADMAGWTFVMDVSKMADGDHEMVMRVESNKGTVRDFDPVPFRVTH
jgi:hypothetical protein